MTIITLNRIILKEFKRHFILTVALFIMTYLCYLKITNNYIDSNTAYIFWMGGDTDHPISLNTVLLKLIIVSIIFLLIGKISNKLQSEVTQYILCRIGSYHIFTKAFIMLLCIYGIILIVISHSIYFLLAGIPSNIFALEFIYLLHECTGFIGIILLYVILQNVFLIDNSYLIVVVLYILNTILPIPISIAGSSIKFLAIQQKGYLILLFIITILMDLVIILFTYYLMKRKDFVIC